MKQSIILPWLVFHVVSLGGAAALSANIRGIETPWYRFQLWESLDAATKEYASYLMYNEETWNNPRKNDVEFLSFASLAANGGDVLNAAEKIGFTSDSWNCYINHYADFTWQELSEQGVVIYAILLGWDEQMWTNLNNLPETEYMLWEELSVGQRQSAEQFCFTKELWNSIGLEQWDTLPTNPDNSPLIEISPTEIPTSSPIMVTSTEAPTLAAVVATYLPTPGQADDASSSIDAIRYVVWSQLSQTARSQAEELGYTEESWNAPGTANVEYYTIELLYEADLEEAASIIADMGFSDYQWDCYMNHYVALSWEELQADELAEHLIALGWSEASWSGAIDETPESEEKNWNDLTDTERAGAEGLCYRYETWDGYTLDHEVWEQNKVPPPTQSPSSIQDIMFPPINVGTESSASWRYNLSAVLVVVVVAAVFGSSDIIS